MRFDAADLAVRVTGDDTDEAFGPQHTNTMVVSARTGEEA